MAWHGARIFPRNEPDICTVIASYSDWFIALFVSVVIGRSNYFGSGFTALNWKAPCACTVYQLPVSCTPLQVFRQCVRFSKWEMNLVFAVEVESLTEISRTLATDWDQVYNVTNLMFQSDLLTLSCTWQQNVLLPMLYLQQTLGEGVDFSSLAIIRSTCYYRIIRVRWVTITYLLASYQGFSLSVF